MVFQSYALYPHMSVRDNIAFALKMAGQSADVIEQKVRKAAGDSEPDRLSRPQAPPTSGGQRQRVAIGRAIVREPKAFLFDEPLSNLDAALRVQMRLEIGELHEALKTTMIYVTHDQVEAMTMADKIVVLDRGAVAQVGSPIELYNKPNNLFVARFIGSPTMNIVTGASAAKRGATSIGIRPEHTEVSTTAGEWPGKVRLAEHLGSDTFVYAEGRQLGPMTVRLEGEAALQPGQSDFPHAAGGADSPVRQGRPAHRLTAARRLRTSDELAGARDEVTSHERQTVFRRPVAACRDDRAAQISARRPQAPASFISASAIFIAPIRRSISTNCSTPAPIMTGRSSAPACATPTRRCARSSRRRTG